MSFASVRARLFVVVSLLFCVAATAQPTQVISVIQPKPGEIMVRIGVASPAAPLASELSLQVGAAATLPAAKVLAVSAPRNSAALLICLDRSGSMGPAAVAAMRDALRTTLVPRAGESQLPLSVAILAFGTRSRQLVGLTTDPALVTEAVAQLGVDQSREGRTKLYDVVAGGLAELRGFAAVSKRLLIVSDGDDDRSALQQAELLDSIRKSTPQIKVDAIGFGALAASQSGSLAVLAGATGGRFAVVKVRDAQTLAAALAQMIRAAVAEPQYEVSFTYVPTRDDRQVEEASLLYRPQGQAGELLRLPVAVAAAAPAAAGQSQQVSSGNDANSGAVPRLVFVFAAALLMVLAFIVVRLLKRKEPTAAQVAQVEEVEAAPLVAARASASRRHTVIAHRWPTPGDGRTVAILRGTAGAALGQHFVVKVAALSLGASPDNDIALAGDNFISAHHLTLKAEGNGLYAIDLDSRNGSELNGDKFKGTTRSLSPGDRITLGQTTFEVLAGDVAAGSGRPEYEPRVR